MPNSRGTQSNPAFIGMWNPEAAANIKNVLSINRNPIDYTKDQMIQLYLMLFPFIAADFAHRDDIFKWASKQLKEYKEKVDDLNKQFKVHKTEYDTHKHIGNMGAPTTQPVKPMTKIEHKTWNTLPEDSDFKYGEKLVTDNSQYSNNITHRKPNTDSTNIKRIKTNPIASSYSKQLKMVPFDIGGDKIKEEDKFANTGV